MSITLHELTPAMWPHLETLFGSRGACGGCWCQSWRIAKGEKWDAIKGEPAKERLRSQVEAGETLGIVAFDGDKPIGWVTFGPRPRFDKLNRAPSLACEDADQVWSIPCFFVAAGARGQGVATRLLDAACQAIQKRGGAVAEGYPVANTPKPLPAAFVWTGVQSLFEKAGFLPVDDKPSGKRRMRKPLT